MKKGQVIIELSNAAPSLNYENAKLLENYSSDNANQEKLSQANSEVELAKSKLDNESSLLERQKKLWASEIGTKNDLDLRELAYKNASNLYNASNVFARVAYTKTIDQISTDFNFVPGSVVSFRTNLNSPFDNETLSAFGRVGKTFKKIRTLKDSIPK